jgi:hypothetical protein
VEIALIETSDRLQPLDIEQGESTVPQTRCPMAVPTDQPENRGTVSQSRLSIRVGRHCELKDTCRPYTSALTPQTKFATDSALAGPAGRDPAHREAIPRSLLAPHL